MTSAFDPSALRVKAFAQAGATLTGEAPLPQFERLLADCVGETSLPVHWQASGATQTRSDGAESVWLHLQADATVPLTCQRCLQPVAVVLQVERDFRFVADEATALAEDDASDEDVLVLSQDFDLLALVEDELLMDLPLVPMHASCESEHIHTSEGAVAAEAPAKPNPFAVLAALKKGRAD